MSKMKQTILCALSLVCVLAVLAGCNVRTSMAYTFSIDNGDSIKISLDTSDDYKLTSDVPFDITRDGETVSRGVFIHSVAYVEYANVAHNGENVQFLDSGNKDGNEYVFWKYNDAQDDENAEYNYAILIKDSHTGIILSNVTSEESAKECFSRLTFSVEN